MKEKKDQKIQRPKQSQQTYITHQTYHIYTWKQKRDNECIHNSNIKIENSYQRLTALFVQLLQKKKNILVKNY